MSGDLPDVVAAPAGTRSAAGGRDSAPPRWMTRGAGALLLLEVLGLVASGMVSPAAGAALVVAPLFLALAWFLPRVAWLLTVFAVPFSFELLVPGTSSALWVPSEPMILLFLGVWAVRSALQGGHALPRSSVLTAIAIVVLVAVLSMLGSRYHVLSIKAILSSSWFLVFGFLYPLLCDRDHTLVRRAMLVLAVSGTAFALYGVVFVAEHGVARWTGNAMGRPFFPEHGTYTVYLVFALAAMLGLALGGRRAVTRWLGLLGAGLVTLAVVLSLARAAYLALGAVFATTLLLLLHGGRARTAISIVLVTLCASYGVTRFNASRFVGLYAESITQAGELSNLERINRWLAAWNMVRAHPLLGVGYGTYEDNYYSYRILTLRTEDRFRRMGVHSEYFRVLSEMGWLGVAAVGAFVVMLYREGWYAIRRARVPADRALAIGALAGVGSYLVHSFFNSYGESDKVVLPFWVFVALVALLAARARTAAAPPSSVET